MVTGNSSGSTGNEYFPGRVVGSKARATNDTPSNSRNIREQYFPGMTRYGYPKAGSARRPFNKQPETPAVPGSTQ